LRYFTVGFLIIPPQTHAQETSSITVTSPSAGDIWVTGSTELITWTSTGSFDQVGLTLMQNDIAVLGLGTVSNTGTHTLTVPTGFIGSGFKIRAVNMSDNSIFDDSASFSISEILPSVTVISPNGGEQWISGQTYRILWQATEVDFVQIYIADDSIFGSGSTNYVVPNNGTIQASLGYYDWVIPDIKQLPGGGGSNYKVRIDDSSDTTVQDKSDGSFSIVSATAEAPSVTVTSPNGGEVWEVGKNYEIKWNPGEYGKDTLIQLRLRDIRFDSTTTAGEILFTYALNTGSYIWTVPSNIGHKGLGGEDVYKIVLNLPVGAPEWTKRLDESNAPFSIVSTTTATPSITVTSPDGGETLHAGSSHDITWISRNIDTVMIELTAPGQGWHLAYRVPASDGKFSWQVEGDPGTNYKIHIWDPQNPLMSDSSDRYFSIVGASSVITPEMVYPKNLQILDLEGSYMFKVEPITGAEGYAFGLYQNGSLIYENVRDEGKLSSDGEFAIHSDNAAHSKFRAGDVEVIIKAKVDGEWTRERIIFVTLQPRKIEVAKAAEHCLPEGTLIKTPDDPKIYVIEGCKKKWIRTSADFQSSGYQWENVRVAADPVVEAYANYLAATANLLRAIDQEKVYRIISGKKLWVPSAEAFTAQNLNWEDVQETSEAEVNSLPTARLIRSEGDPKVYFITDNGFKKWIRTAEIFNSYSGNKWEDIVDVVSEIVESFQAVELMRLQGGTKVYKLEGSTKRWIRTTDAFDRYNFDWKKIVSMNQLELNYYTEGESIE